MARQVRDLLIEEPLGMPDLAAFGLTHGLQIQWNCNTCQASPPWGKFDRHHSPSTATRGLLEVAQECRSEHTERAFNSVNLFHILPTRSWPSSTDSDRPKTRADDCQPYGIQACSKRKSSPSPRRRQTCRFKNTTRRTNQQLHGQHCLGALWSFTRRLEAVRNVCSNAVKHWGREACSGSWGCLNLPINLGPGYLGPVRNDLSEVILSRCKLAFRASAIASLQTGSELPQLWLKIKHPDVGKLAVSEPHPRRHVGWQPPKWNSVPISVRFLTALFTACAWLRRLLLPTRSPAAWATLQWPTESTFSLPLPRREALR